MFRHYDFKRYNYLIIINVLVLAIIGIIAIGSATQINTDLGSDTFVKKQIIGLIIGFICMIGISIIDYHFISKFYPIIYMVMVGLLLAVLFMGKTVGGATRWVAIGGFVIQPSEFAKLLIVIFLAKMIDKYRVVFNKPWFLLILTLLSSIVIFLVLQQPDLSTSVMIAGVFLITIFVGGLDVRYIIAGIIIMIPILIIGFELIKDPDQEIIENYQRTRIMT
ncbi:MAG: FtsW/RodA/SpoVE family cell cycle protein, partial [Vallitaleaceae bacterium]|nr:FtsW/RodA/SpoVE family cell cycle protein [Vallitaleaceae bacterium]